MLFIFFLLWDSLLICCSGLMAIECVRMSGYIFTKYSVQFHLSNFSASSKDQFLTNLVAQMLNPMSFVTHKKTFEPKQRFA